MLCRLDLDAVLVNCVEDVLRPQKVSQERETTSLKRIEREKQTSEQFFSSQTISAVKVLSNVEVIMKAREVMGYEHK